MQRKFVQPRGPDETMVVDSMPPILRRPSGEAFRSTKWLHGLVVPIGMLQHLRHLPPTLLHQHPLQRQTLLTLRRSTMRCLPHIVGWWRTFSHPLNAQSAWKPSERLRCPAAEAVISSAVFVCSALSFAQPAEPPCHWPVDSDASAIQQTG